MPLVHLASRIYGTPLLIARPKLEVILSVLGSRIGLPDLEAALPVPTPRAPTAATAPGIAVIPVHGTLVRRALGVEAVSGLTSYGDIAERLDQALADPRVNGILLDVDSPGGEAGGVFELADRIRAATTIKPIWAHANDSAYSAAYAIAASATRLTLSRTAGVGSIGVIALHVDQSVKDAKDGVHYTAIHAGQHKNDFSPHAPLSPQATLALQAEVNRLHTIFIEHVARMRGVDPDAVRATEAGLLFADDAVETGLADAIASFDQVITEFAQALARPSAAMSGGRRSVSSQVVTRTPSLSTIPQEPIMQDPETPACIEDALPPAPVVAPADESVPPTTPAPADDSRTPDRGAALAIAELCLLAGQPQRTAEFLAAGVSEAQVRKTLLGARADQTEIASRIAPDAASPSRTDTSPVVAAVKKLTSKEK
jgi:signal peptide peptidase SppA